MLYILRPLVYAVLVHQIEHYKANHSSSNSSSNSSSHSDPLPTTTINSVTSINNPTTAIGMFANLTSSTSAIVRKVLDAISVDALLNILALAISFVSLHCVLFALFLSL